MKNFRNYHRYIVHQYYEPEMENCFWCELNYRFFKFRQFRQDFLFYIKLILNMRIF